MKNSKLLRQWVLLTGVAVITACGGTAYEEPGTLAETSSVEEIGIDRQSKGDASPAVLHQAIPNSAAMASFRASAAVEYCCPPANRENYASFDDNPVKLASEHPVSTFSIDVDTGSYSNVRRFLTDGQLPPPDAVRVEELINYFSYDYSAPDTLDAPFNVVTELAPTPWNNDTLLLHIGLKGFEVADYERPPANLVFLVDVSGSMHSADKLFLLKDALAMLTQHLDERDSVAIVVYAGAAGVILEPTSGADERRIIDSLERLTAGGSTNGGAGIHLAYKLAQRGFIDGGINRVILATDGDFNVGTVNFASLVDLVEEKREGGVALTALGFGTGNYNDKLLEQIADAGNGNYAYIDSRREARKVLVDEMSSTLLTIAKDVKIQIEFNPVTVAEYRLIGYENRLLRREDFNNDKIDAGEIGAGHTVTALYEITPVDSPAQLNSPLRYGPRTLNEQMRASELALVRLRYKQPDADESQLIERIVDRDAVRQMSRGFRFAAAVSAFGQQLRGGVYLGDFELEQVAALAAGARGTDRQGYRAEFIELVEQTISLSDSLARTGEDGHPYHVAN